MNSRLIIVLSLLLACRTQAQNYRRIDSLKAILNTTTADTTKGVAIWTLVDEYQYTRPDTGLYYARMGLDLIQNKTIRAEFDQSKNPLLYSFAIRMYLKGASACAQLRDDSAALTMAFNGLRMAENSRDKVDVGRVYANLSNIYYELGEPAIAIEYLKKTIQLNTSADDFTRYDNICTIGRCFYELGNLDSALYYVNIADAFFSSQRERQNPRPALYFGNIYRKEGKLTLSLQYYRKAFLLSGATYSPQDLSQSSLGLADILEKLGRTDSAIYYARVSFTIASRSSFPNHSLTASKALTALFSSHGQTDSAFKYQQITESLKDNLNDREKVKLLMNYTYSQQTHEKELILAEKEYRNKILFYSFLSALFIASLFLIILFSQNRRIRKANSLLKAQKEIESIELQNRISEATISALKSQMNPHFIFNALNNIQSYIWFNHKKEASLYLGKFSELMRKVLDNSSRDIVSLAAEMELISLYLDLEKSRFGEHFITSVRIDPAVNIEDIEIPPMLIQPYVENSIKHGLLHVEGVKHLSIEIKAAAAEGITEIWVIDNGIGRRKSYEINKGRTNHHSFATKANERRVELYNHRFHRNLQVDIIDDIHDNGLPKGTIVVIRIPD
jgi:tetratricopeptide (TPR) repeat protein